MKKKSVSVVIPYGKPEELIDLADLIIEKHEADGASSKLNSVDMADMKVKTVTARAKHELAKGLEVTAEVAVEERNLSLGLAGYQYSTTPGTVLYYVCSVRDFLSAKYVNDRKKLEEWGYKVDRKDEETVRIPIPKSPKGLIDLSKKIVKKHKADGAGSVLSGFDMVDMEDKVNTADSKHKLAMKSRRDGENATEDRNEALGFDEDQTSKTPGTVLYYVVTVRGTLLSYFRGSEHELGLWGFEVNAGNGGDEEGEVIADTDQSTKQMVEVGVSAETEEEFVQEWGDGGSDTLAAIPGSSNFINHEYEVEGVYRMKMKGKVGKLKEYHSNSSRLTNFIWPVIATKIMLLVLQNNLLPTEVINLILITIDSFGTSGGVINLLGNAAPTGAGLVAKANLEARGWMVLTS